MEWARKSSGGFFYSAKHASDVYAARAQRKGVMSFKLLDEGVVPPLSRQGWPCSLSVHVIIRAEMDTITF